MKWMYNFRDNLEQRETIVLQPGNYKAVFRAKYSKRSFFSVEQDFTVESGKSVNVKLYR